MLIPTIMSIYKVPIIKDNISRRQRQYNINMLFDKLMVDFEDHFNLRLLSVADGTFDGVFHSLDL